VQNNKFYKNEFHKSLIKTILTQIRRGETTSFIGMPGIGKSHPLYWIKKHASKNQSKIFIIPSDLNNLVSIEDLEFYRLLLLELTEAIEKRFKNKKILQFTKEQYEKTIGCKDSLLTFNSIKKIVSYLISNTDLTICIMLDSFEKGQELSSSVFNTLYGLRNLEKMRVVYLFVTNQDISRIFQPTKTGSLFNLINYNKHWLTPLEKEETYKLAEEFASLLDSKLDKTEKEKIWKISGGHSWYIKTSSKLFAEKIIDKDTSLDELAQLSSIKTRGEQIWENLDERSKNILKRVAKGEKVNKRQISEFLKETGIVKLTKNETQLFSPLFEHYIQNIVLGGSEPLAQEDKTPDSKRKGLSIDLKHRVILRDGKALKAIFTKGEFNLLKYLFKNESLAISRDEVAEVIWGKEARQKYSDWAIDKIISRIRDKIEDDSRKPKHLITLRGVGFKFIGLPT